VEPFIKVNGNKGKDKDKVSNIGKMGLFMKDTGKIIWLMAKAD